MLDMVLELSIMYCLLEIKTIKPIGPMRLKLIEIILKKLNMDGG
jgi:hypothetical protein